jgi:hypothetical protein
MRLSYLFDGRFEFELIARPFATLQTCPASFGLDAAQCVNQRKIF